MCEGVIAVGEGLESARCREHQMACVEEDSGGDPEDVRAFIDEEDRRSDLGVRLRRHGRLGGNCPLRVRWRLVLHRAPEDSLGAALIVPRLEDRAGDERAIHAVSMQQAKTRLDDG